MSDEGAIVYEILLTAIAIISVLLFMGISFLRAVVASVSAGKLEQSHSTKPGLYDVVYDARKLGSSCRALLMLLDTIAIAAVAATGTMLFVSIHSNVAERFFWVWVVLVGVVGIKVIVHIIGDLLADAVITPAAQVLRWIVMSLQPALHVIEIVLHHIHRAIRTQEDAREQVEEELTAIIEEAVEEGTLEAGEYRILQNIMRVRDVQVEDVMTPRNVMSGLRADMTILEAARLPELQTYSRLPVWEGSDVDNIVGYVLSRDVLVRALAGEVSLPIRTLVRKAVFIPENITIDRALEEFLKRRQHLFIVVDEYGGVEGLLTLEDVIETILGAEIVDEVDRVVDMRQFAQQQRDRRIAQHNIQSVVGLPPMNQ